MQFVKAVSHVHSVWSYDGKWELKKIAKLFGYLGYSVILLAEHDRNFTQHRLDAYREACQFASTPFCFLLPGIEYSDPDNRVHILAWGDTPFLGESLETIDVLQAVHEHQGISVMAHPARKEAFRCYREKWSQYLMGIEVWNRKSDGFNFSREGLDVLKINSNLIPFVSLDFHNKKQLFPLSIRLAINDNLTEANILTALRAHLLTPLFMGIPALSLMNNPLGINLSILEKTRKFIAQRIRK